MNEFCTPVTLAAAGAAAPGCAVSGVLAAQVAAGLGAAGVSSRYMNLSAEVLEDTLVSLQARCVLNRCKVLLCCMAGLHRRATSKDKSAEGSRLWHQLPAGGLFTKVMAAACSVTTIVLPAAYGSVSAIQPEYNAATRCAVEVFYELPAWQCKDGSAGAASPHDSAISAPPLCSVPGVLSAPPAPAPDANAMPPQPSPPSPPLPPPLLPRRLCAVYSSGRPADNRCQHSRSLMLSRVLLS